ncbi:MAG: flagellar basal body rod protein FlgC [bacterium]|nr:flagellar basal body rod protein FlgC [bacterium]
MPGFLNAIDQSARGLSVQRSKMNVVAENIANAETTKTKDGGPYKRQRLIVEEQKNAGSFQSVMREVSGLSRTNGRHLAGRGLKMIEKSDASSVEGQVVDDPESSFKVVHDPSHPHADSEGYVKMPDIEIVTEMVDMMAASRAYEANTVAIGAAKKMAQDALDI